MTDESNLSSRIQVETETSLGYMLKLAAPMIVTNISFTIMQFVDRFMVSRLGTEALAAILPAGIISFVPASFAIGVAACASRCRQGLTINRPRPRRRAISAAPLAA